jgi:hypothetical protein
MIKVKRSKDCDNSPKNRFAQEIAIALETGNAEFIEEVLVENASAVLRNGEELALEKYLDVVGAAAKPTKTVIDRVITHGKAGAVDGVSHFKSGDRLRFCHVIHFANAKGNSVSRVSSYGDSP